MQIGDRVLDLWFFSLLGPFDSKGVIRSLSLNIGILQNLICFFDSRYDFDQDEALFVKIGARVLDLWVSGSFGHNWPKTSF